MNWTSFIQTFSMGFVCLKDERPRCQNPEGREMENLRGNDRMEVTILSNERFCQAHRVVKQTHLQECNKEYWPSIVKTTARLLRQEVGTKWDKDLLFSVWCSLNGVFSRERLHSDTPQESKQSELFVTS